MTSEGVDSSWINANNVILSLNQVCLTSLYCKEHLFTKTGISPCDVQKRCTYHRMAALVNAAQIFRLLKVM
jgi:hypothetical protein